MLRSAGSVFDAGHRAKTWHNCDRPLVCLTVPSGLLVITAHISNQATSARPQSDAAVALSYTWVLVFQRKPAPHELVLSLQPSRSPGSSHCSTSATACQWCQTDRAPACIFIITWVVGELARAAQPRAWHRSTSRCRSAACSAASLPSPHTFFVDRRISNSHAPGVLCRPGHGNNESRSGSALGAARLSYSLSAGQRHRQRASSTWRCSPSPRCHAFTRDAAESAVIVWR